MTVAERDCAAARRRSPAGLRWILGTPYAVQGSSQLVEVPILYFIKFALGLGDAGGQLFDSLRNAGWFAKPLWGLISDRVPLFGYRRKSWFVLMALLATAFWGVSAALTVAGVRIPTLFLAVFILAFTAYAFVDVVCDALMVELGREHGMVGRLVNFQWGVLAAANAVAVLLGSWLQSLVTAGELDTWVVFGIAAVPPLLTAAVGVRFIDEERRPRGWAIPWSRLAGGASNAAAATTRATRRLPAAAAAFRRWRRDNRLMWYLVLFLFFWQFTPSVGFIERSYLIDVRGFTPASFGIILSAGGVSFLASVLCYAWITRRFPQLSWDRYLFAMVGIGVLSFPLSFFLYLDPGHPWWQAVEPLALPGWLNPLPDFNRYEWFRLAVQTVLGFATIPAFMVPLTIAGETVSLTNAGLSYAFLMSLTNVTNMFEGLVGAGLYKVFQLPGAAWLVDVFSRSWLDIAGTGDERTSILEMFVYISLTFTLLTVPFILLLRRELRRRGIVIRLAGSQEQGG